MIVNFVFSTIMATEILGGIVILLDITNKGSNFVVLTLILLQGVTGMLFGAFISSLIDTVRAASFATSGCIVTILLMSGKKSFKI